MSGNGGEGLSYKRIREQSLASDSFLQEGAGQVGDGFKKLEQRFMLPPPSDLDCLSLSLLRSSNDSISQHYHNRLFRSLTQVTCQFL
jgi:hypothetical protein